MDRIADLIQDTTSDINHKMKGYRRQGSDKKREKKTRRRRKEPMKSKKNDFAHQPSIYFNRLAEMKARKGDIRQNTKYERRKRSSQSSRNFKIGKKNLLFTRKSSGCLGKKKKERSPKRFSGLRKSSSALNLSSLKDNRQVRN